MAGTIFGEVRGLLFVAGAIFGEIWNDSRSAKRCIFQYKMLVGGLVLLVLHQTHYFIYIYIYINIYKYIYKFITTT